MLCFLCTVLTSFVFCWSSHRTGQSRGQSGTRILVPHGIWGLSVRGTEQILKAGPFPALTRGGVFRVSASIPSDQIQVLQS